MTKSIRDAASSDSREGSVREAPASAPPTKGGGNLHPPTFPTGSSSHSAGDISIQVPVLPRVGASPAATRRGEEGPQATTTGGVRVRLAAEEKRVEVEFIDESRNPTNC